MKTNVAVFTLLMIISFLWWNPSFKSETSTAENSKNKEIIVSGKKTGIGRKSSTGPELVEVPESDESVNELIYKITDREASVLTRTKDILALRKIKLSKADEQALIEHILLPHKDEVYSVKNDIIEHLVRYGTDQVKVGDTLLNIMQNTSQSRVMREYVLQYVPEYYLNRWLPDSQWEDIDETDRLKFNDTLWNMTELTEGSMAGGALFALYRISDFYEDVSKENVFDKSHEILINPSYMNPNRMGAVQILSFSNNEKYFDTARKIVLNQEGPILLQVTAMNTAAKSIHHDKKFIEYLRTISKGNAKTDPSLKRCAQLTLKKLNHF